MYTLYFWQKYPQFNNKQDGYNNRRNEQVQLQQFTRKLNLHHEKQWRKWECVCSDSDRGGWQRNRGADTWIEGELHQSGEKRC